MKKFTVNETEIRGKRVIVVDDSIVRGTTSRIIAKLLYQRGAKEVHFRISSPPYKNPCYLGIDTPYANQLIAAEKALAEIQKELGVDSLAYLTKPELLSNKHIKGNYCTFCFDGIEKIKKY
jgi:amidophosphoribosyltransferase